MSKSIGVLFKKWVKYKSIKVKTFWHPEGIYLLLAGKPSQNANSYWFA